MERTVDVASLSPYLGEAPIRYDPLPNSMISQRSSVRLVRLDGETTSTLAFQEPRDLKRLKADRQP